MKTTPSPIPAPMPLKDRVMALRSEHIARLNALSRERDLAKTQLETIEGEIHAQEGAVVGIDRALAEIN